MEQSLKHILESDATHPLNAEELQQLKQQYPAFTLPMLMALKHSHLCKEENSRLAAHVAVTLSDDESMRDILGDDADVYANFYPQTQPETPSTTETIDTFLATFGSGVADARETDALTKAIFNPMPDYATLLAAEEQNSIPAAEELDAVKVGEQDAVINRFIANSKGRVQLPESEEEQISEPATNTEQATPIPTTNTGNAKSAPESGALSESLAKIMIKNHNYQKALEIISDLHLKNPEKSIYFADQIRFLRKLIVNENKKQ